MPQTGADREVRRCIYHVPYPLDPNTTFGGQKRAVAMLKALTQWGEVWVVAVTPVSGAAKFRWS